VGSELFGSGYSDFDLFDTWQGEGLILSSQFIFSVVPKDNAMFL